MFGNRIDSGAYQQTTNDRGREQYQESANTEVETDNESSSETLAEIPTESAIHSGRHQTLTNNSSLLLPPMTVDQMSRHLREQYNHNREPQTAPNCLNVVDPYSEYQIPSMTFVRPHQENRNAMRSHTGHVNDGSQNIRSERSRTNPTSSRRSQDKSRAHVVDPLDSDDG